MAKKISNIVVVNDFDYIQGGASKVAIQTANLLKEKNKDLNVYFFSGCHDKTSTLNNNIVSICTNQGEFLKDKNKFRGIFNGLYNFKAKVLFKKMLNSLDKEETIIHIHGWTKCLSSSVFDIAFKMNFKVVLTMHDYFTACPNGGYFNYPKNEICQLKPLSYKCLNCNCDSRNYTFKLYRVFRQFIQNYIVKLNAKIENVIGISDLNIRVLKETLNKNVIIKKIYNPIELKKHKKIDWRKNEYYLYVGRVSKEKGVNLFCDAISKLNLKGIVVGDGSEKSFLENKYNNIKFVGWKTSSEVNEYIKNAKCLIFPSLWYEGAPLTPLEAMAYGIPSLVNEVCSAKEYVDLKHRFNSKNIKTIIQNFEHDKSNDLGYIVELNDFSSEKYVENLIKYYNEVN